MPVTARDLTERYNKVVYFFEGAHCPSNETGHRVGFIFTFLTFAAFMHQFVT